MVERGVYPWGLGRLGGPALALEAAALGLVAWLASYWVGLSPSPLTGSWRDWSIPAGWNPSGIVPAGRTLPMPAVGALIVFGALLIAMTMAQWWALRRSRSLAPDRRAFVTIMIGAAIIGVTLILLPVLPSDDLWSYALYGRIGVLHHANPLVTTPDQFPGDPFLRSVFWRGTRAVYGPVWLLISDAVTRLAQAFGGAGAVYVLLYKFLGLISHLLNAALIWAILGRIAPQHRLTGTLLYAWNPLVLWEFAASGHNDAVMVLFFLLGCWLLVQRQACAIVAVAGSAQVPSGSDDRWAWLAPSLRDWSRRYGLEVLALIAWGCSIATKYALIVLIPLWLWAIAMRITGDPVESRWRVWGRRGMAVGWRGGVILGTVFLTALPFWAGPGTLVALGASPPAQQLGNSLMDSVSWPLRSLVQTVFGLSNGGARDLVIGGLKLVGVVGFAVIWLGALIRRAPGDLSGAWGWVLFAYLVVASGWFWPWYVTWLLAIVALREGERLTTAALLLAAGALVLYPFLPLMASPIFGYRSIVIFGPALAYLGWMRYQGRRAQTEAGLRGAFVTGPSTPRLGK